MNSLNLNLHKKQAQVFSDRSRFKLLISGRRFGKSRLLLTTAIHAALAFNQPIDPASPPVVLIAMPTLKAAKAIHWQPLLNLLENQPFVESINRTDNRIKLKGDKPDILLRGADNDADSLRGLKLYWAGLDEFQDFSLAAWEQVIYPALTDTPGSRASLIATPKGKSHWLYRFHLQARADRNWSYYHFFTEHNPFISRKLLKQAKLTLPPRVYKQEFEASFEDFEGQFFSEFDDEHIVDTLPTKFLDTYLGVDWGDLNPALTVVGLTPDYKYYILDAWDNETGSPIVFDQLIEKAASFCDRYNIYRGFADPSRPASILDFQKIGRHKKLPGLAKTIAGFNKVKEGIQIVNNLFYQDRLYINSKLTSFIEELKSYHRKTINGEVVDEVADGQKDHRCFIAGTMVLTNNGWRRIEELCIGDLVDTPMGFKPIVFTANSESKVIDVIAGDGILTVTPDHPFLSINAHWIRSDTLYYSYIVTKLLIDKWNSIYTELDTERFKGTDIFTVILTKLKSIILTNISTDKYGLTSLEKYRRVIIFTIKTVMSWITELRTWNVLNPQNICDCILRKINPILIAGTTQNVLRNICQRFRSLLKSGTTQKKVSSGIESMESIAGRLKKKLLNAVSNVILSLLPNKHFKDSALISASQKQEDSQELMILEKNVPTAEQLLQLTNTPEYSSAPVTALNNTERLARVYTIEVKDAHCYFVKSGGVGFLVSNCDSLRYILASLEQRNNLLK